MFGFARVTALSLGSAALRDRRAIGPLAPFVTFTMLCFDFHDRTRNGNGLTFRRVL